MLRLRKYSSGITTDNKWMVCERTETMCSWAVCAPFAIKYLEQTLPCKFSAKITNAT